MQLEVCHGQQHAPPPPPPPYNAGLASITAFPKRCRARDSAAKLAASSSVEFVASPTLVDLEKLVEDMERGRYEVLKELSGDPRALADEVARIISVLAQSIPDHRFFAGGICLDVRMLSLIMRSGIFTWGGFTSYLTHAAANAVNDDVRRIMVKQLDDELGNGAWDDAHWRHLHALKDGLQREAGGDCGVPDSALLEPGSAARLMRSVFDAGFLVGDPFWQCGAFVVDEFFAQQFFISMLEAVETLSAMGKLHLSKEEVFTLHLHSEMEKEHVQEGLDVCYKLGDLDEDKATRVLNGALSFQQGFVRFLDKICEDYYTPNDRYGTVGNAPIVC
eukprot:TRINITY_DN6946_c0_g1_i3.p1 TRINITY_DN6946_c0_g1~~TRINITY_DN6946_c0_g1_i3.p1  ORF type:complete len:333 (+),score=65.16 TRINITY_DN6946_c0_g1_i3:302-1300(+)